MGQSLARNIMQHGFSVSVYNIETEITKQFTQKYPKLFGYESLEAFVNSLEKPRKIILMVTAGRVVDSVIASLKPLLAKGDILIDCGNSYYEDTQRRMQSMQQDGFYLIGSGVSGGEKGALHVPASCPPGNTGPIAKLRTSLLQSLPKMKTAQLLYLYRKRRLRPFCEDGA
mgnify:CR=1 FL=1